MIKKGFVGLLIILIVVMCSSTCLKAQEIYYPILKLDINNNDIAEIADIKNE